MKKTTLRQAAMKLALVAFALLAPWVANAQETIPYTEGFESMSSADDLTAAGWISYNSQSGSVLKIETSASNVHSGSKALNMDSWDAYSSAAILIAGLPTVDAAINTLQITFSYKVSTGNVSIGYLTDANDASTFVALEQYNASSSYTTIERSLNDAPAEAARIAIKYLNYYRCYIDDIEVRTLPTCDKPVLNNIVTSTTNSATISWTPAAGHNLFDIYWSTSSTNPTDGTTPSASNQTGTSYTITGLTSGTQYYVWIRGNCGTAVAPDVSGGWTSAVSFATACEAISAVGYSDNFDSYSGTTSGSTNNLPTCWNYINTSTYNSYMGYPNIYSSNASSSPNCLRFYSYYSSWSDYDPQPQYAILPPMEGLAGKQVTLQARGYNASSTFKIGTMTDPSNAGTFVAITEQALSTSYQEFEYVIPANAGGNYLAIMIDAATSSRTTNGVYIDDISIANPPACPKPSSLAYANVTDAAVTLSWTAAGEATAWQICLNGDEENLIDANTNPFTVEGLAATTAYTAKVRTYCSGSSQSEWTSEVNFSTTAVATVVGDSWSDDFEGGSCGWELVNGTNTNKWCWGTATNNGGTHAIYVSNDDGATTNYSASGTKIFATKLLQFADGKYEFSYDWLCKGESTYDFLRVALVPASQTLTAGTDYSTIGTTSLPSGWIALDGGGKLNLQEAWQTKVVAINVAAGNYYMVLVWRNDSDVYPPAAAVDNVSITRVACPYDVAGLEVADDPAVTTTTATITWTAGEATQWQVATKTGDADWAVLPTIYSTNSAALTGLTAATTYQVKARAYCNASDQGTWCDPIPLTTACPEYAEAPFTENFDGYTVANTNYPSARVLPICWSFINTSTYSTNKWYPTMQYYSYTNYSNSSPNYIRFYIDAYSGSNYDPQDQYLILPAVQDVANLRIKLQASVYNTGSTYDATFKVGIMTDPTDASTFVEIAEKTPATTSYEQYIIPFNGYTGSGNHIAIKVEAPETPTASYTHAYRAVYIDDITVEEIPNCVEPSALQFVSSTTNTADIRWTAGGTETSWDIYYSTTNAAPTSSTAPLANVTTNPATISGLTASTTYYVWVRAHCGDGDGQQSPWIGGISFATECAAFTVDAEHHYTQDFNGYAAGSTSTSTPATYPDDNLPLCWKFLNRSDNSGNYPQAFLSSSSNYAVSGNCLFFKSSSSTPLYAILPEFTSNISDLMLTFTYRNEGTGSSNGTLYVSYMTDPTDASTFNTANAIECDQITTKTEMEVFFPNAPAGSYIAFKYQGGSSNSYYLSIDNVSVEPAPTCRKPSALACDSKTAHTATLSWTENGSANAWQVSYSTTANFDPADGTIVDVDANPGTIEGLAQSTTYYAYVRANCGGGDYSAWNSTRISFTTPAGNRTPTGLTVDNATITSSQATASWTPRDGNTLHESYDIYWALASVTEVPAEPTAPNLISGITATSQVISGLEAEITYKVWVRDNCGTDGYSNWSSTPFTFMTAAACQMPDGLAANNVTNNSATISWNTYGQSTFNLRYSTDGANWTPVEDVNGDSYTFNGTLTGNTAYQVQVQPTCADAETWSAVFNFTTKCDAVVDFPWTENFNGINSGIPSCWDNSEGTTTNNSYKWSYYATGHESYGLRFNSYNNTNSNTNFLKTPVMDFPDGKVMQLTFWYKNPTGGDFSVYISTDGGDTYETALATDLTDMSSWTEKEIVLNSYVGTQNVVIVFKGTSNYGNGDAYIYLDDVAIAEAPTCSKPSGLTFESATTTTATLSWTAGGSELSWDIYYSTENVAPTTQTGTNTADNPATISGLYASTTYYVWVRAHCTNEDQSPWIGGISFATQCEVTTVDAENPFFEGFENSTFPPTCWSIGSPSPLNGSNNWTRSTSNANNGAACAYSGWYGDIYLYTPTLHIDGTNASLSFSSYNDYADDYDKNSVLITTDGGTNWTELWSPASVTETHVTTTIDLTSYVGLDIQICFKYEGSNAHGWSLDDVNLFVPTVIEKAIEANKWYAIATPVTNAELGQETLEGVTNLTSGTYDLYGYTESTGSWTKPTTALTTGKGYIYRRSAAATLSFVGVPNTGDRLLSITNSCPDGNIGGLNLVGNPFPHAISRTDYYTLQPNGLWLAHDAGNIGAAEGFLVYTSLPSTDYEINDVTPSKKNAPAASPAITFTVSNGEFRDVAYARFDGSAVLPKIGHLEPNAPALSIPVNGKKYAIADLGNGCESFDMVFSGIGDYTISASGDATYLHLIDKVTGKDIDLLSQPYTFKAGIGDITSRFIVKLVPDGETVSAGNFAFRNGNGWTIEGDGTLEAYDALGRRIFAQEISSSNYQLSKASFPAAGVYVLRMGGNSQKIVVTE